MIFVFIFKKIVLVLIFICVLVLSFLFEGLIVNYIIFYLCYISYDTCMSTVVARTAFVIRYINKQSSSSIIVKKLLASAVVIDAVLKESLNMNS